MIDQTSIEICKYLQNKISKIEGIMVFNIKSKDKKVIKKSSEFDMSELAEMVNSFPNYCDNLVMNVSDGSSVMIRSFGEDHLVFYANASVYGALNLYLSLFKDSIKDQENSSSVVKEKIEPEVKSGSNTEKSPKMKNKNKNKVKVVDDHTPSVDNQGLRSSEEVSIKRIQKRFLRKNDIRTYFSQAVFQFRPKNELSGEFFWIRKHGDVVRMALADCHLNGTSGALLALYLNTLLDQFDFNKTYDFVDFHSWLNKQINAHNLEDVENSSEENNISVNISLVTIDQLQNTIHVQNAGNGLVLAKGKKVIHKITPQDQGNIDIQEKIEKETQINLFTDGLTSDELDAICDQISEKGIAIMAGSELDSILSNKRIDDLTFVGFTL